MGCDLRRVVFLVALVIGIIVLTIITIPAYRPAQWKRLGDLRVSQEEQNDVYAIERLRIAIPASSPDINLCKTLLTMKVLDYPVPALVGWNIKYENSQELGGGSHLAKISESLKFLEKSDIESRDLILMIDGYDVWFQLPPVVFLDRYRETIRQSDLRLVQRIGDVAVTKNGFKDSIIFASGKRCAPNQVHTVACYAIPPTPIRSDLYGGNTDTVMGWNKYSSLRQQFLNSGMIVGRMEEMQHLFRKAQSLVDEFHQSDTMTEEMDNGSGFSVDLYHGSDQSVFSMMLGRQEYSREWSKKQQASSKKGRFLLNPKYTPRPGRIEGTDYADILEPSFTHERFDPEDFAEGYWEHEMTLDYYSDLIHETVNSERDARWIRYDEEIEDQIEPKTSIFECDAHVPQLDGSDILEANMSMTLLPDINWRSVPLYTHVCLGRVPVIIHHNGDKTLRDSQWNQLWMYPHLERVKESIVGRSEDGLDGAIVAESADGVKLRWREVCPSELDAAIFGDGTE